MILSGGRIELILAGRYADADVEQPTLDPQEIRILAQQVHEGGKRPSPWTDPRGLALALGFRLCPLRVIGQPAFTDGKTICYRPTLDTRARGWFVGHELTHCVLGRCFPSSNEADAIVLSAEILAPYEYASRWPVGILIGVQRHAPAWLLAAQSRAAKAWQRIAAE